MKILVMFLVHRVEKIVREPLQGKVSLPGRYGLLIEELGWNTGKTLNFFWGRVG